MCSRQINQYYPNFSSIHTVRHSYVYEPNNYDTSITLYVYFWRISFETVGSYVNKKVIMKNRLRSKKLLIFVTQ